MTRAENQHRIESIPYKVEGKMRASVAYQLIVLVVVCPYFCMGEDAGASDAQASANPCCCKDGPIDGDNRAPQPQDQSDSDCLCHGAIVDGVNAQTAEFGTDLFVTDLLDLSSGAVPLKPSIDLSLGVCHFPPLLTGRDVCALTCALLL